MSRECTSQMLLQQDWRDQLLFLRTLEEIHECCINPRLLRGSKIAPLLRRCCKFHCHFHMMQQNKSILYRCTRSRFRGMGQSYQQQSGHLGKCCRDPRLFKGSSSSSSPMLRNGHSRDNLGYHWIRTNHIRHPNNRPSWRCCQCSRCNRTQPRMHNSFSRTPHLESIHMLQKHGHTRRGIDPMNPFHRD